MKTSLAYIDEAVSEALAHEKKTPSIPTTVRERAAQAGLAVVAGFSFKDEAAERRVLDDASAQRRSVVVQYLKHRGAVAATLNRLGITPLAIVPKTAWERICKESDLYRLAPDKKGEVRVSNAMARKSASFGETALVCAAIGLCVLVGAVTGVLLYTTASFQWWSSAVLGAAVGASWFIVEAFICGFNDGAVAERLERVLAKAYISYKVKGSWAKQLHGLLPDGISPGMSTLSARLVLPQPPDDVAATLLKAKSLELKVAAVADAISFSESTAEIYGREIDRFANEVKTGKPTGPYRGYASFEEWLEKCPIIYCEHESAVAIIAQFGDFPIERQVVDMVVKSEFLI